MIFFFYGEEPFQPSHKIQDLTARFLTKNPSGGGLEVCDWDEGCTLVQMQNAIAAQNLFAQNKLIIIKNLFAKTNADVQKEIRNLLEKRTGDDVIVLWEHGTPRKNATLFTWLLKNAHTTKAYENLTGQKLIQWIARRVQSAEASMKKDALERLVLFVGSDLHKLSSEIDKLVHYARGRAITVQDVELLVDGRIDANIFETVEALASDNKVAALAQLKKQLLAGDDAHHVLAMYAYQLRTLLSVAGAYYDKGMRDKRYIAKECAVHPFVAQKAVAIVSRIDKKRLLRAHTKLVQIDRDVKNGKRDVSTALEMFVMQF